MTKSFMRCVKFIFIKIMSGKLGVVPPPPPPPPTVAFQNAFSGHFQPFRDNMS